MADWKQITARIRRARTSKDPAGQLANLYEKTHDAMAAFELAKYFEAAGNNAGAAQWYVTAGERFRRADWKTKAKEAAARLGAGLPLESSVQQADDFFLPPPPERASEQPLSFEQETRAPQSAEVCVEETPAAPAVGSVEKKRRRRGRRGGRHRRKTGAAKEVAAAPVELAGKSAPPRRGALPFAPQAPVEPIPPRVPHSRAMPQFPVEPLGETGGAGLKGRYGDPGLSSRISLLEMQFRRLLTCPPAKLDEADHAPVGPGVFVLTDSDLTTYYYVEACQTLRIAIGNLLRGGSSRRGGGEAIKPQLAEHLGIPESRVAKYLSDHCVVRWLQLDEGASHFAHFVIAVLRPILHE